MEERRSFCRLCPALCGVDVTVEGGTVTRLAGDRRHLLSRGYTCTKGRRMPALVDDVRRLDEPLLRDASGELVPVSWDRALDDLAERLDAVVARSGGYAVGTYSGTMLDAAGRAYADRLLRAIGSPSRYTSATVDSIAKVLVPKLMAGRERMVPAVDFDRTTLLLVIGQNMVVSHGAFSYFPDPVRYLREVADRGEVWVLDPRRTETARLGTRHLRPRAGSDFAVMGHLIRELLRDGADEDHLARHGRRVDELRAAVEPFDAGTTAAMSGLDPEELAELLAAVRHHERVGVLTGTGVTMSANANVTEWLVFALQIVTGSFERPGGRWFNHSAAFDPSTDDVPDTSGFEPGPRSRPEIERFDNQFPCSVLVSEIEQGHVEALMVIGGNPLVAFPQPDRLARALDGLDVLAVWDIVPSATARRATHVFPCPSPLERADLVTPVHLSAVYTQYTPAVVEPRASRRPMWWSIGSLARRMGYDILPDGAEVDRCTDEDVFAALAAPTGVPWGELVGGDPVPGRRVDRWVTDTVLPDGRWDLAPPQLLDQLDRAVARGTPALVLGNRRELRHTNSTLAWDDTGEPLDNHVFLSEPDAAATGLADGDEVTVTSPHGSVTGVARVDPALARGLVNVPHGYESLNVGRLTATDVDVDPLTGMPTLVGVPVELRRTGPR